MNVLVDTNVWLDVLQDRQPHYETSARALTLLERPEHSAFLCATTVTTLFYLVQRAADATTAFEQMRLLLGRHDVAPVDGSILLDALDSGFADYEDAVLECAARRDGIHAVLTRNVADFASSQLAIYTPAELLASLTI